MELRLRDFYLAEYPDDDYGAEIDKFANFQDLFEALDNYRDVYDCIGVGDSLIRVRLFTKLASLLQVDYGDIYEQWMRAA